MDCGKCLRHRAVVRDRACPGTSKILVEAHLSHIMMRTRVSGSDSHLFFCCKCGCYTVSRSAGLTKPCSRTPYHSTSHNRLMASLHPVTKKQLDTPSRVLSATVLGLFAQSFDSNEHVLGSADPARGMLSSQFCQGPGHKAGDFGSPSHGPALPQAFQSEWDLEDENSFDFGF